MMFNVKIFAILCGIMALTTLHVSHAAGNDGPVLEPPPPPAIHHRQNYIAVHYVTGSHSEVGISIGRVFGNMIRKYVDSYGPLKEQLKAYAKPEGKQIYDESLNACKKYFPQYVIEMEGIAQGSGVPFVKLFLMTLDDTLLQNLDEPSLNNPVGCTSILVNQPTAQLLGHTEDALRETVNNYFILAAHIIPSEREKGGTFQAREEIFEALTYAGHVSGYASGHNYYGLVFSINTIFVSKTLRGRIPREFICRALLGTKADLDEVLSVLMNEDCGTADGFNVNVAFLNQPREQRVVHTIEVVPDPYGANSEVKKTSFPMGSNSLHTNRLLHISYPEEHLDGYEGSIVREKRYKILTNAMPNHKIMNEDELLTVLGNQDDMAIYPMFNDNDTAKVNTINLGLFDLDQKTWTMWGSDPLRNRPLLRLPLTFTDLVSPPNNHIQPLILDDSKK